MSTFKIVDDVEYTVDIPAALSYGFKVITFVGASYGPSLWFCAASLKTIPPKRPPPKTLTNLS